MDYSKIGRNEAIQKDPKNQELKNEFSRARKLSSRCRSKSKKAAGSETSCEDAIDNIIDSDTLCTAEKLANEMAYFLSLNNSTQDNEEFLTRSEQALNRCLISSYDICK